MPGDSDYGTRLLAQVDTHLRLFQARVAEHGRAIAWVEASLAEVERRSWLTATKRRIGDEGVKRPGRGAPARRRLGFGLSKAV